MKLLMLTTLLAQTVAPQQDGGPPTATPLASPAAVPLGAAPSGAATIVNSSSTNTTGYRLVIAPDGSATVAQDGATQARSVAAPQARWLFAKLHEAEPVDSLGGGHCMKSASFGTSTVVTWNGRTSSDLSCDFEPASRELLRTIGVIVRQLALPTFRFRRRLLPP